jgi:hypothetical protein
MNLKKLAEPFEYEDLEFRIDRSGVGNNGVWAVALTYITARAIHDRLDEVCGPDKWQMRYKEHNNGTVCEIGIKVGDEWIWKAGGSDSTKFEAFKGGLSGAEKRAGVPWGIGRYLYKLSRYPDIYVKTSGAKVKGWNYQGQNKKTNVPKFYWENPPLPPEFLPLQDTTELIESFGSLCKAKDMIDEDYFGILDFYCNSKKIPVTDVQDMDYGNLKNLVDKFDIVFNAFMDSLKEK